MDCGKHGNGSLPQLPGGGNISSWLESWGRPRVTRSRASTNQALNISSSLIDCAQNWKLCSFILPIHCRHSSLHCPEYIPYCESKKDLTWSWCLKQEKMICKCEVHARSMMFINVITMTVSAQYNRKNAISPSKTWCYSLYIVSDLLYVWYSGEKLKLGASVVRLIFNGLTADNIMMRTFQNDLAPCWCDSHYIMSICTDIHYTFMFLLRTEKHIVYRDTYSPFRVKTEVKDNCIHMQCWCNLLNSLFL